MFNYTHLQLKQVKQKTILSYKFRIMTIKHFDKGPMSIKKSVSSLFSMVSVTSSMVQTGTFQHLVTS